MNFNILDLIKRIEGLEKDRLSRDLIIEQAVNVERIKKASSTLSDEVLSLREQVASISAEQVKSTELFSAKAKELIQLINEKQDPIFYDKEIADIRELAILASQNKKVFDLECEVFAENIASLTKENQSKDYDEEIELLNKRIDSIPAPKNHDEDIEKINTLIRELPKQVDYSGEIKELQDSINSIPEPKDYNADIDALNKAISSIPEHEEPKSYDEEIKELRERIANAERDKQAFDSARRLYGEQLSNFYIELNKKIELLEGKQNGE